jgi:diacylglycerol kinase
MKKFFGGFPFAFNVINYTFNSQSDFGLHCIATFFIGGLSFYPGLNKTELLWVITAIIIVFPNMTHAS